MIDDDIYLGPGWHDRPDDLGPSDADFESEEETRYIEESGEFYQTILSRIDAPPEAFVAMAQFDAVAGEFFDA